MVGPQIRFYPTSLFLSLSGGNTGHPSGEIGHATRTYIKYYVQYEKCYLQYMKHVYNKRRGPSTKTYDRPAKPAWLARPAWPPIYIYIYIYMQVCYIQHVISFTRHFIYLCIILYVFSYCMAYFLIGRDHQGDEKGGSVIKREVLS